MKSDEDVDVVIIWVDGNDQEWQKHKAKYSNTVIVKSNIDDSESRYRNWNNLQYLFRGIEKYMPWVRKVHFVTYGHVPAWLNIDYEKLNFVKHEDYIPEEFLPTFNANPIELNIHRIEGLSEKFIFFNDDMFITKSIKKSDFFRNNKPLNKSALNYMATSNTPHDIFPHILLNVISTLNKHFNKRQAVSSNLTKWFSRKYGAKTIIKNLALLFYGPFTGLSFPHMPAAFLKTTFLEVWKKEKDLLHETSSHKFRDIKDVNQYLMTGWQIASGNFYPKDIGKNSKDFYEPSKQVNEICNAIRSQKYSMICINDNANITDYDEVIEAINASFKKILPHKSAFEL